MKENKTVIFYKGTDSWAEGHYSRFWTMVFKNPKQQVEHGITHFENDYPNSKKYHAYIAWTGCMPYQYFDTDNLREAFNWLKDRVVKSNRTK